MLSCWFGALVCAALWAQADDDVLCIAIYPPDCQSPWYHGFAWRVTFGLGAVGLAALSIVLLFLVVNSDRARRAQIER